MKESTRLRYRGICKNYVANSMLAHIEIGKVSNLAIKTYYAQLIKAGKSESQLFNLNKVLKRFFNYCIDESALMKNPCNRIKIKRAAYIEVGQNIDALKKKPLAVFTVDEIERIKVQLENNRLKPIIYLALSSGAREGELLALTWEDIDFNQSTIHITKALSRVVVDGEPKYLISTPKTQYSIRTVPIPENVMKIMYEWKLTQTMEKIKAGEFYNHNNLIFCTETGNPIDRRNLLRAHSRILKRADVEYRKFHAFRHTYATQLFEHNVPLKTVSSLLGHSSIKITADTYTHVLDDIKADEVAKINALFA